MSFKKDIMNLLEEYADLMEFSGENPFKINAFRGGANVIRRLEGELEAMLDDESIKKVKGIGKGLQSVIYEFYETGKSRDLEELKSKIPKGRMGKNIF